MLDDALVQEIEMDSTNDTYVSILVVLDDALVLQKLNWQQKIKNVSILVVLDDALVLTGVMLISCKNLASQSLLCWTML